MLTNLSGLVFFLEFNNASISSEIILDCPNPNKASIHNKSEFESGLCSKFLIPICIA